MKICLLASGSSGNAAYIEGNDVSILLDAGLSGKEIKKRLSIIEVNPKSLDAIVLTHGHRDHICGAGILARRYNLPIYTNHGTLDELQSYINGSEKLFRFNDAFHIGSLRFEPFSISHDAQDTVAFNIYENKKKISFVTDLGCVTHLVKRRMLDADVIILEANHDIQMTLKNPRYPWALKQRIMSRVGHLSNEACGEALLEVLSPRVKHVFLAHLSQNNNTPSLALDTITKKLLNHHYREVDIQLAYRHRVAKFVEIF